MFEPVQTQESRVVGAYFQAADGGWYLTDAAKAEATAMYYERRLAYAGDDKRHPIGVYNSLGEIVPFSLHETSKQEIAG